MKLLGSTKSKVNRNKNDANVPDLEITEVILPIIIIKKCKKFEYIYSK